MVINMHNSKWNATLFVLVVGYTELCSGYCPRVTNGMREICGHDREEWYAFRFFHLHVPLSISYYMP